ncbi:MAG: hypothetical protein L3K00_03210 [Thermoplasmata archaeon]|nr:hypothetical protein [Thermoplasmata archaeon]
MSAAVPSTTEEEATGKLDRCISELFWLVDHPRDEVTLQTLKHHAEDMVLAGRAMLRRLGFPDDPKDGAGQFLPARSPP